MNRLLLAWFVFCVASLMLYAFTGVALWSKLTAPDDAMRGVCLLAFYIPGLMAYPISRAP
jgi:hypothetical protein